MKNTEPCPASENKFSLFYFMTENVLYKYNKNIILFCYELIELDVTFQWSWAVAFGVEKIAIYTTYKDHCTLSSNLSCAKRPMQEAINCGLLLLFLGARPCPVARVTRGKQIC